MRSRPASSPSADSEPQEAGVYALSHREVILNLFGLLLGMFYAALDQTMVIVALPVIVGDLGGLEQMSLVVAAYVVTATVSMPLYGKIGDLYGRSVVFQAALGIFVGASALSGLATNMTQLILFRALQGLGGGGLMTLSITILGDIIPPRERGRYMGYFTATSTIAPAAGLILGGILVDAASWRWIFFAKLPLGIIALFVIRRVLRLPSPSRRHRIDVEGAALLVAAVTSVMLLSIWGGTTFPWASPTIVGLGVAAPALTVLFVLWDGRIEEPLLPLRLFRNPGVGACMVVSFLVGTFMYGAFLFLPLFLQAVIGVSATASGLLLVPMMGGIAASSVVSGNLVTRTGRYRAWLVAGMGFVVIAIGVLGIIGDAVGVAGVLVPITLLGVGVGMLMPVLNLAVQNAVEHRDLGVATSTVTFVRSLGGAVGVSMFGGIFTARLHVELARLLPNGAGTVDLAVVAYKPEEIRTLSRPVAEAVVEALSRSVGAVFLVALPIALLGFALIWFLREVPLRENGFVVRRDSTLLRSRP